MAEYLDVPLEIREATPTTDTYSAHSSQEDFFFRLPFDVMDVLMYALENDVSAEVAAQIMDLTETQVQRAYDDFERKRRTTQYLRTMPIEYGSKVAQIKKFLDIVVGYNGINYLFEIKNPDYPPSARKLTPDEKIFHDEWCGQADIILYTKDILEKINYKHS